MNETQEANISLLGGALLISQSVWTTWIVMAALAVTAHLLTRKLSVGSKVQGTQTAAEGIVISMMEAVRAVDAQRAPMLFPFIATIWLFVLSANLIGIFPGMKSPTADLSTTSALAIIVFFSVHWFGVRSEGWKSYFKHYLSPTPIMLPFHIISEISRTVALAVRLFGNMMSLGMAAAIVLLVAGLLVPVPLLLLHIIEAIVQAYIFGMLALIFIASGIASQRRHKQEVNTSGP